MNASLSFPIFFRSVSSDVWPLLVLPRDSVFHSVFTFLLHSAACVTVTLIAGRTVWGFGAKSLRAHCTCMLMCTHTIHTCKLTQKTYAHVYIDTDTNRSRGVSCLLVVAVIDAAEKEIVQKGCVRCLYNTHVNQTIARSWILTDNTTYGLVHVHTAHSYCIPHTHKDIVSV